MGLDLGLLRIQRDATHRQRSHSITVGLTAAVDTLHLLKGHVGLGLLLQQWLVVARLHLGMRIVGGISQLVALSHRVPESNRLVQTASDKKLCLRQVANVHDGGIVSGPTLVRADVPGIVNLERIN